MERFPASSKISASEAAAASKLQENPYSRELERLDVVDLCRNDEMLKQWLSFKEQLLNEAMMVRQWRKMDKLSGPNDPEEEIQKKIKMKKKSTSDEKNTVAAGPLIEEDAAPENKPDEEESDEEAELEDDFEEDNDYMDSYFDNGEDYVE